MRSHPEAAVLADPLALWRRIEGGELAFADLATLSGKTLACWCVPEPRHGDVPARAAEWAARRPREQE